MGMSLEEASKIKNTDIAKELALPPVKLHCSSQLHHTSFHSALFSLTDTVGFNVVLAEDAIRSAIRDYRKKQLSVADAPSGTLFTNAATSAQAQPAT